MRYQKYLSTAECSERDSSAASKILHAAQQLFLEKGFQATTTRDIASKAGVTLGLIPYYYKTKEALAHKVAYDMMDHFYHQFDHERLSLLCAAERMYLLNLLIYKKMFTDTTFGTFLFELAATTETTDEPTEVFITLSQQVIQDYRLQVTAEENELYLCAMMGARKMLLKKYWRREIQLTYDHLTDLIISNYLYNLGLSDEEIAQIISTGQNFMRDV